MLKFRPHHFLCSLGYTGMGYSAAFVANFDLIAQQIKHDDSILIQVTLGFDNICSHCPHQNLNIKACDDQTKIDKLDKAHLGILKLKDKQILSYREAKKLIKENMSLEKFYDACKFCSWQKLGLCEKALRKLKES